MTVGESQHFPRLLCCHVLFTWPDMGSSHNYSLPGGIVVVFSPFTWNINRVCNPRPGLGIRSFDLSLSSIFKKEQLWAILSYRFLIKRERTWANGFQKSDISDSLVIRAKRSQKTINSLEKMYFLFDFDSFPPLFKPKERIAPVALCSVAVF